MFITPFRAHSEQEHFFKNSSTLGIEFNYQWQSEDGIRELKFLLAHTDIDQLPTSAPAYNPLLAQNYIRRNLLEYAKTIDPKIANILIKRSAGSLNIQVSGKYPDQVNEITATLDKKHEEAEADYLAKNYYVPFKNQMGRLAIKQDHRRYAEESSNHLSGIVLAIKEQINNPNNAREFINFTLNWLQAIPYDTLKNRISSNGSGFAAPQQLLLNNKGDCDSKSTLFLALLKSYNPKLSAQMVFLPNHALVGINLNPNETDAKIIRNYLSYILAEPTGAAQYKLGEIAPSSHMAIRNHQFTTELF
jgi:transglutaminase-like putative cysteine protease